MCRVCVYVDNTCNNTLLIDTSIVCHLTITGPVGFWFSTLLFTFFSAAFGFHRKYCGFRSTPRKYTIYLILCVRVYVEYYYKRICYVPCPFANYQIRSYCDTSHIMIHLIGQYIFDTYLLLVTGISFVNCIKKLRICCRCDCGKIYLIVNLYKFYTWHIFYKYKSKSYVRCTIVWYYV